jgi:RnfABCDGE-type electron transport complex G subunit
MVAFAACIVSFPALMAQWPALGLKLTFAEQFNIIAGLAPRIDAMSGATPLDAIKTALKLGEGTVDVPTLLATQDVFGNFAGRGWEWVTSGYLLGGLWLWQRKIISWHAPLAFIWGLSLLSGAFWLWHPQGYASPLFHLFSGGAMLGAFFIVTDPVSGCTTTRGKLIFGFLAGSDGLYHTRLRGLSGRCRFRRVADESLRAADRPVYAAADLRHEERAMTLSLKQPSAASMALRTAVILLIFVVAFTSLLAAAFLWTRPAIEAAAAEEKMKLIGEVLPRAICTIMICSRTAGSLLRVPRSDSTRRRRRIGRAWRGKVSALVFEAVAPDGYSGKIRLLLAVAADGTLLGVRVTQHRETPGLGDYIEPRKDRNKERPWIRQFDGLSLATVTSREWRVRKDGGRFDSLAGATVTPRAVIKAVHQALQYFADHRQQLLAAASGGEKN